MIAFFQKIKSNKWILLIIALSGVLRIYKLSFQSPWLDELHTLIESDPYQPWSHLLFYLKCCDQHPLLFFTTERIFFHVFGHTETVARIAPLLAGVLSVWAIYHLGKELLNEKTGRVAAFLTAINFFHISYSQEARPYIFLFLFGTLSFLFLTRLIKSPGKKNAILYATSVLLMIYSHYFGLFALAAQMCIGGFFYLNEDQNKSKLFRLFLLSAIIVLILFLPMLPYLLNISNIKSFWIPPTDPGFAVNYFYEYFGTENLFKPVLLFLLFSTCVSIIKQRDTKWSSIKNEPLLFTFILCSLWITIVLFIPLVRSLLTIPMLQPRYTIVVLPAILLILSTGITQIQNRAIQYLVISIFTLISITDLFWVKKYYKTPSKTQFRELSEYVFADSTNTYPIVTEEPTAWHHQYYLKKYGTKVPLITGPKNQLIDSILNKNSARFNLNGFWLIGVHGEKPPPDEVLSKLDTAFILTKKKDFFDSWARLYVYRNSESDQMQIFNYDIFPADKKFEMDNETVAPIWEKEIETKPITLKKGSYKVSFLAKGTPADKVYPLLKVYFNNIIVGNFSPQESFEQSPSFKFEMSKDGELTIKLMMENDAISSNSGEDRNAFIKHVIVEKVNE